MHLRRLVAGVCAAIGLAGAALLLSGSAAPTEPTGRPFRVLQANLCNSGIAGCYTGRSVDETARLIRSTRPDVVTLNEVCDADVDVLAQVMADVHEREIASAFQTAPDRRTGGATKCLNGRDFGVGLLVLTSTPARTSGGIYPVQDVKDPEIRVWLCMQGRGFDACTTHLASTDADVALAQCHYLLSSAIPDFRDFDGYQPTVLGGDLNLKSGNTPDVRPCIPLGYSHYGDGDVQHILMTSEFDAGSLASIGMNGASDHPALLVTVAMPQKPPSSCIIGPVCG